MITTERLVKTPVRQRITSIDFLRGAVMIIMVLDHVRHYFHAANFSPTDLSQTSPELFLTRWITHFCAPVFVLLAGVSAYLYGQKVSSAKALSRFLFSRGLWLVVMEVSLITFGWQFDIAFGTIIFQVIWAIGISMMLLAAIIHLPINLIFLLSVLLIFGHNALDIIQVQGNSVSETVWAFLHQLHLVQTPTFSLFILYPIVPWVGVMMLGYCLGQLYTPDFNSSTRRKTLLGLGLALTALFVIIRATNSYGDPTPWSVYDSPMYTILSFLNTYKYPPSLLYLLMTIGPALIFLGLAENWKIAQYQPVVVIGRVPFFFYVVHIYLLHALQLLSMILLPEFSFSDAVGSAMHKPTEYGFSLTTVYVVWGLILLLLYPLSEWFNRVKNQRKDAWWVSYV